MSRAVARFRRPNALLPAPVPNLFEVIVQGQIEGQMTINTFYYQDGGAALTASTETNLASQWVTSNGAQYRACLSADWSWTLIKAQCITSPARLPGLVTLGLGNGTGPGGHEPSTVAAIISRQTGTKGQCGRGRVMLPAVPTAWVTSSVISLAAGIAAYNAFATQMLAAFVTGTVTYTPFLFSKGTRVTKTNGAAPLVSAIFRTLLGTIRRRRIGKGK